MSVAIEERRIKVGALMIQYLTGGEGAPLVLLHGDGDSARSWRWVLPALARMHHVYAPSLPGFGDSDKPAADYSPIFFETFVTTFLDALGLERVIVVGTSTGGIVALHLALSDPARVSALVLVDSTGLGREINPIVALLSLPGYGELATAWSKMPLGAAQRVWWYITLLFRRPERVPRAWLAEQYRLTLLPGFLEATVAAKRAQIGPCGQRQVLVDELPRLRMPTLVTWGVQDMVVPHYQAQAAVARLRRGHLASIPDCGHMPHVERPDRFIAALGRFLAGHAVT